MTTDTSTASTEWRRGFTAALMLASLLGGTTLLLCGHSLAFQIGAVVLAAAAWIVGWGGVLGRRPGRFPLVVLLAVVLMAIFVVHLIGSSPPFPLRLLQIATTLCYGAVLLAAFISMLHLASGGTALLVSFSLALGLFLCEVIVPHLGLTTARLAQTGGVPRWVGGTVPHPTIGYCNTPDSSAKTYYPDNPRGYFEEVDPIRESWRLETHEDAQAQLDHSSNQPEIVRVNISKIVGAVPWHVQLQQIYLQFKAGKEYVLSFRARADRARTIAAAVGEDHAPWQGLGLYRELEVNPQWAVFENAFVANGTDPKARIHFDVGASDAAVEFADVVLREVSNGIIVKPCVLREFFVTYNFNALGCRGHDDAIPRPAGTFRIVALGDSYTLGVGVHERDTFTVRLERLLNKDSKHAPSGLTYEVINCGVCGYATREERLSYELISSKYAPQVVLIVMVFNDDMSGPDEAKLGYIRPLDRPLAKYEQLSSLWLLLHSLRYRRPPPDFSGSVRELLTLNNSCRRRGAKLGVVLFRNFRDEVYDQLFKAINDGTKGTGIPILDLGSALLNAHNVKDLMVHQYDGHPNEIAHAIAAEEIFRFLKTQNLLRQ
jgi:hypothetical protein